MQIRIGTRGSKLALIQAEEVKRALLVAHRGYLPEQFIIVPIKTSGDKIQNKNLYDIGGKGLFIKELEEALLANTIDIAVHSMKDVPGIIPDELVFSCVLKREDTRDAFLSGICNNIKSLPKGATIGTCSPRRIVQILALRPDIKIVTMRGNVDTRLKKLEEGAVDATILAVAGLKRSQIDSRRYHIIDEKIMLPAVAQGAIGVESRKDNIEISELLSVINHQVSHQTVVAERGFLEGLEASCNTPVAVYSKVLDDHLHLTCLLAEVDGSKIVTIEKFGQLAKGYSLGQEAAIELKNKLCL